MIPPTEGNPRINTLEAQKPRNLDLLLVPGRVPLELRVARAFSGLGDGAVIQAPAMFTLSQWAADFAARVDLLNGQPAPLAPDSHQVGRLWYEAVASGRAGLGAAERIALARLAREAERLLHQWIPPAEAEPAAQADRDFRRWRRQVRAKLQAEHWAAPEEWVTHLAGQLRRGEVDPDWLPQAVTLAGFVEFTVHERELFSALEALGVAVREEPAPAGAAGGQARQGFASPEQEISAAARWAGAELAAGRDRIAVIVNGLQGLAGTVRRIFENHFQAAHLLELGDLGQGPFRVSCGEPLGCQPLIADALLLLRLAEEGPSRSHDFPCISRMLLSRNWAGGAAEAFARAGLERELRATGRHRFTLARVAERAAGGTALPELVARLNALRERGVANHPAQQLLDWLATWGWPGDVPCQGAARAQQVAFLGLLERLSRQPFDTAGDCLAQLEVMCREESAPAGGGAFSPIQVLTPEEAYGLRFDSAWVANLSAENWPPRPIGNPFLGAALLRQVPRAEHGGMLDYAERLTAALKCCADRVRFSWCDRIEDLDVSPSPLILDVPQAEDLAGEPCTLQRSLAPEARAISGYRGHPWLTATMEAGGRPVAATSGRRLRAAVRALNYQSACPLAGYLFGRLDAEFEDPPQPFADDRIRGRLVHGALERLYRPCIDSAGLPDPAAVADAAAGALADSHAAMWLLPAESEALQRDIAELLREWLAVARGWQCGAVASLEVREDHELAGFTIGVRIDRVDRRPDGRLFLLDYKTGKGAAHKRWANERLGDVQLPLYAVLLSGTSGSEPCGVATAHVRAGEMAMFGLSGDPECAPDRVYTVGQRAGPAGAFSSWEEAIAAWRERLTLLLSEYRAGDCRARIFDPDPLARAGLEMLLRQAEGEAWLRASEP